MTPYWTSHDGRHVLYHGDCLEVLPTLAPGTIDAVVTDPPYGIGARRQTARPSNYQRLAGMKPRDWDGVAPDLAHVLLVAKIIVIWGGNYFQLPPSRGWLAWHKPDAPPSMSNIELCWTNIDMNARQLSHSISATNAERVDHPTQKPERVMQWCLGFLPTGRTILDPYTGSGTTGVACIRTGRRFIGVELSREYCDIAVRRMEAELAQPMLIAPEAPKETQGELL